MKKSVSLIIFFLAVLGGAALLAYAGIAGSGPGDSPEAGPDADDVSALIEELENDPTIRETVETYAPDPQQWWDWYAALPEKSDSELSKVNALEWVELFSLQPEEGRTGLYYDLLQLPAKLDD